jgi:hypothetical protein
MGISHLESQIPGPDASSLALGSAVSEGLSLTWTLTKDTPTSQRRTHSGTWPWHWRARSSDGRITRAPWNARRPGHTAIDAQSSDPEAVKAGVTNIVPAVGDGQRLPYTSASFDAAT